MNEEKNRIEMVGKECGNGREKGEDGHRKSNKGRRVGRGREGVERIKRILKKKEGKLNEE